MHVSNSAKYVRLTLAGMLAATLAACASDPKSASPGVPIVDSDREMATAHDMHAGHEMHAGHDMHSGHDMHGGTHGTMPSQFGGPYQSMGALGSGTALVPADSPGYMWHFNLPFVDEDRQSCMAHGEFKFSYNNQGGRRGESRLQSQNWLMSMCEFKVSSTSAFMLRGMFTFEPWSSPRGGFPQLFQSGETYGGQGIIDAQHPHNFVSELSIGFTQALTESFRYYVYLGFPGDREDGPPAFMHRPSALENPSVPLSHHAHDAGHITNGVVSFGFDWEKFRLGMSVFHGREPGEDRLAIDIGSFDSYSVRLQYMPTENWALGTSYAHVRNPEASHPGDVDRFTAFALYSKRFDQGYGSVSAVFGRNLEQHGTLTGGLLEGTLNFQDRHYLYGRVEYVDKPGLTGVNIFGQPGLSSIVAAEHDEHLEGGHGGAAESNTEHGAAGNSLVGAFTFGYAYDVYASSALRIGLGADVTFYDVPSQLKETYGDPVSFMLNLRVRPGRSF